MNISRHFASSRRPASLRHAVAWSTWLATAAFALAACGGGDDAALASALIGPAGGTVAGSDGAKIVVPAGALAAPTTIAIEQTSAGAPALPSGFVAAGKMFAFTPHGTTFAVPVTITIPIDPTGVPAGQSGSFYKTDSAGVWQRIASATVAGNFVSAEVTSFSNGQFGSSPPVITQQPRNATVAVGDTATFSVVAINAPPFTYQWEDSIDGGMTWRPIGAATGSTFTTAATALADSGKRFRVVVSNPDGPTSSNSAVLTVNAIVVPVAITTQPANTSAAVGAAATFSVVATGSNLQYRWRRSSDGGANFTDIAGANNASYTLANAQIGDNNAQFLVVVSNAAGPVTSSAATLTVTVAPPPLVLKSRLAAHDGFSLALSAAGVPYSWGSDSATALGNGPTEGNRLLAAPLGTLLGVASVVAGDLHGVAVRSADRTVWGFGYAGSIVCNAGGVFDAPVQIAGAADIVAASTGSSHTLLLTSTGTVMSFGCNSSNQLGRPATMQPALETAAPVVGFPAGTIIVAVAAGRSVSLALDSNNVVWSWGQGPLGDGSNLPSGRATPTPVPNLTGVVAIAAGADHVLVIRTDRSVWAWGSNTNGKLGDGTTTDAATPRPTLLTAGITAVAAGAEASLALRDDRMVLSWGSNNYGGLGAGPGGPFTRPQPAPVVGLTGVVEVAMGSGLQHGLARLVDGTVWAWGDNRSGQLGNGTTSTQPVTTPVQVTGLNLN